MGKTNLCQDARKLHQGTERKTKNNAGAKTINEDQPFR
jgi:hypothetical protein